MTSCSSGVLPFRLDECRSHAVARAQRRIRVADTQQARYCLAGHQHPVDIGCRATHFDGHEGGESRGTEEFDIGEIDCDPLGLGGVSQRVIGEIGCVDGIDLTAGADLPPLTAVASASQTPRAIRRSGRPVHSSRGRSFLAPSVVIRVFVLLVRRRSTTIRVPARMSMTLAAAVNSTCSGPYRDQGHRTICLSGFL